MCLRNARNVHPPNTGCVSWICNISGEKLRRIRFIERLVPRTRGSRILRSSMDRTVTLRCRCARRSSVNSSWALPERNTSNTSCWAESARARRLAYSAKCSARSAILTGFSASRCSAFPFGGKRGDAGRARDRAFHRFTLVEPDEAKPRQRRVQSRSKRGQVPVAKRRLELGSRQRVPRGLQVPHVARHNRLRSAIPWWRPLARDGALESELDGAFRFGRQAVLEPLIGGQVVLDLLQQSGEAGAITVSRQGADRRHFHAETGGERSVVLAPRRRAVIGDVVEARDFRRMCDYRVDAA